MKYEHRVEDLTHAMTEAGFNDVAVVWRIFADTILMAFVPGNF